MSECAKQVEEIIAAIDDELAAITSERGRKPFKLSNGTLTAKSGSTATFAFPLPPKAEGLDLGPAKVRIQLQELEGEIVALSPDSVSLALPDTFENAGGQLELFANQKDLLIRLRDRFDRAFEKADTTFARSSEVFRGKSEKLTNSSELFKKFPHLGDGLNKCQKEAVESSYARSLSILWGPPGTGKTNTIAKIVEAHISAGRRVLILSQANLAVDGALKRVTKELQETLYSNEQIIRIGSSEDADLLANFPLVYKDNAVKKRKQPLMRQLEALTQQKLLIDIELQEIQDTLSLISESHESKSLVKRYREESATLRQDHKDMLQKTTKRTDAIALQAEALDGIETKHDEVMQKLTDLESRQQEIEAAILVSLKQHNVPRSALETLLRNKQKPLSAQCAELATELDCLENEINSVEETIMNEARVVATTITQTFLFSLYKQTFDVVIVDEVSMVSPCQLFWAVSKATQAVTLVGDFKQLSPIGRGKSKLCKQWFTQSIFDRLKVNTTQAALKSDIVTLLKTQYRMAPGIACIANNLFYDKQLENHESTHDLKLTDTVSCDKAVMLIDTAELKPSAYRPDGSSKRNFLHAQTAASLALKLSEEFPNESIGIITPYKKQATLIEELLGEKRRERGITANTVHSFQGSEKSIIIFDTLESPGGGDYSTINEESHGREAEVLLNVALTRARKKLYIVANTAHLRKSFRTDSFIGRIIKHFSTNASMSALSFFRSANAVGIDERTNCTDVLYDESSFWSQFEKDIESANKRVSISSAFLARPRTEKILPLLEEVIARGVQVTVFCRPPDTRKDRAPSLNQEAYDLLRNAGVQIQLVKTVHQKIIIIDNHIAWNGSLNILSQSNSYEVMHRIINKPLIKEFEGVIERLERIAESDQVIRIYPKLKEGA
jgi:superfamily I DNA/RNA helicase